MGVPQQRQLLGAIDQFVPEDMRRRQKQWYSYQAVFNTLTAGGNLNQPVAIDNDADFLILNLNAITTDTTQLIRQNFSPFTLQLQYTGGGSSFFAQADHIENVVGDAGLPGLFGFPYLIPGGGTLQVNLVNLDTVTAYVCRLSFQGVKFYR